MAVTFGNTGNNASQGTTSFTFNNNGSYLIVAVDDTAADGSLTVKYNSVSLTQFGTTQNNSGSTRFMSLWGLANPAQGNNTLAITGDNGAANFGALSISGDNGTPASATANSGVSSSASVTITTTIDNSFLVGWGFVRDFSAVGAGTTQVLAINGDNNWSIYRSTSAVTPAGSSSLNVTTTNGAAGWNMQAVVIAPALGGGDRIIPFKSLLGVGK